jgi:hypothetical protein
VECIGPVTSGTNEITDANNVYPRLLLSVWVLYKSNFRLWPQALNVGDLYEIVDAFPLILEVEARVLESSWELDDRLA